MLYLFHGTDTTTAVKKSLALIGSLRTKRPDATFVRIEASDWSSSVIQEHLGGQGLFSNKYIIFLDRVSEKTEGKEGLLEFIPAMQESTNIFIVLEGKLNIELKKAFEKSAEKIVVCDKQEAKGWKGGNSEDFNIFALADAVGNRDQFKAWMIYRQAVDAGMEGEAIIGTLFWQVKSMILARDGKSASETGLSPFVFSKAKKQAQNYSEGELRELSQRFITIYHDGHRGMVDIELGVEKMMLGA